MLFVVFVVPPMLFVVFVVPPMLFVVFVAFAVLTGTVEVYMGARAGLTATLVLMLLTTRITRLAFSCASASREGRMRAGHFCTSASTHAATRSVR